MEIEKDPKIIIMNPFKLRWEARKLLQLRARRRVVGKDYNRDDPGQREIVKRYNRYLTIVIFRYAVRTACLMLGVLPMDSVLKIVAPTHAPGSSVSRVKYSDEMRNLFTLARLEQKDLVERISFVQQHPDTRDFFYLGDPVWRSNINQHIEKSTGEGKTAYAAQWKKLRELYVKHGILTSNAVPEIGSASSAGQTAFQYPLRAKTSPEDFTVKSLAGSAKDNRGTWFEQHGIAFCDNNTQTVFVPIIDGENATQRSAQVFDMWFALHDHQAKNEGGEPYIKRGGQENLPYFGEVAQWLRDDKNGLAEVKDSDAGALVNAIRQALHILGAAPGKMQTEAFIYRTVRMMLASSDIPVRKKLWPALIAIANDPTLINVTIIKIQ